MHNLPTCLLCTLLFIRSACRISAAPAAKKANKYPPRKRGDFSFGYSPNTTDCAQVRFLLACQPCNCYLLPVNGFHHKPPFV